MCVAEKQKKLLKEINLKIYMLLMGESAPLVIVSVLEFCLLSHTVWSCVYTFVWSLQHLFFFCHGSTFSAIYSYIHGFSVALCIAINTRPVCRTKKKKTVENGKKFESKKVFELKIAGILNSECIDLNKQSNYLQSKSFWFCLLIFFLSIVVLHPV